MITAEHTSLSNEAHAHEDVAAGQERLAGIRDRLARHGQAHVPVAEGGFTLDSGLAAMSDLLARQPGTDGVFAANNLMVQGARGRRVGSRS